jgi:hypothetical protein
VILFSSLARALLRPVTSFVVSCAGVALLAVAHGLDPRFAQPVAIDAGVTLIAFPWFVRLGLPRSRLVIAVLLITGALSWTVAYLYRGDSYLNSLGLTVGLTTLIFLLVEAWLGSLLRLLGRISEKEYHDDFQFWDSLSTDWVYFTPRADRVPPVQLGLTELERAGWSVSAYCNATSKEIVLERPGYVINVVTTGRRPRLSGHRRDEFLTEFECRIILGRRDTETLLRRLAELPIISHDP